ncbi:MAG: acyl-CoA dehydratase activase [Dehalococcoidia bacterium]|nr:acyl-CoA dehydratase activase [Dehalococcoidia bacterium]
MEYYLGIDVGSVSTKLVVLDGTGELVAQSYLPTQGTPIAAVREGLKLVTAQAPKADIAATAITGSGRELISAIISSGLVKNEISTQAAAAACYLPDVRTVIEIGGQDSKLILLRDGLMADFAMNTVCAAGTGSFLDHQAARLGLSLENFGALALKSIAPARIAGRCTVFAESDMIHQQQIGASLEDVVYGLCKSLVHNYLISVASGKEIHPPVVLQGGVARNPGIVRAFKDELGFEFFIPPHPELTGAIGAALLAKQKL